MGITAARHSAHVTTQQLAFFNYRKAWPHFLFRHEPIENAISILKSGELLSRVDAMDGGHVCNDIAPDQIIGNRDEAYDRVRLYFRPRTPTQFHIEGIRKTTDYYQGKHAGFLVMFLLNSERILTDTGTRFSCGNMQSSSSSVLDSDAGFDSLDFSSIYHDSAHYNPEITRKRCAEVLPESPLHLEPVLEHIVVRSDADVQTMKYLLNSAGISQFSCLVRKTQGPGIFFNTFTGVDYIDAAPGKINFKLRYSKSAGEVATDMRLIDVGTEATIAHLRSELKTLQGYYWEPDVAAGRYQLQVFLEGCFAHDSIVELS